MKVFNNIKSKMSSIENLLEQEKRKLRKQNTGNSNIYSLKDVENNGPSTNLGFPTS